MLTFNKTNLFIFLTFFVYAILTIYCLNNGYFWDNIQQTSKEAHWYFLTNFKTLLMPAFDSGAYIVATGYHPPLMGLMTAALWKIFGYKLWVSHVFVFFWSIVLMYNLLKTIRIFFSEVYVGSVFLIVLIESTLLTQFAVASPDFIMFAAFIMSLRGILTHKPVLLAIGMVFLCCINMRGIFTGTILLIVHIYFTYLESNKKIDFRLLLKTFLPYLPVLILLSAYFIYYFVSRGWFFSNTSNYAGHYSQPTGFIKVMRHLASYILRSVENGRIIIWAIGIYVTYLTIKSKTILTPSLKALILVFLLLTGLYFLFVFITQMPFTERYFMPQFFVLTIVAMLGIIKFLAVRNIKFAFLLIICFELTGHFWIYPEKIVTFWDCTLAHLPYYELRENCFAYIEHQKIDYKDISASFCLYEDRRFVELENVGKIVGDTNNRKYYIYSNISNACDEWFDQLKTSSRMIPVKRFEKGLVYITIYKNTQYKVKE
jgi:hypothetical protein